MNSYVSILLKHVRLSREIKPFTQLLSNCRCHRSEQTLTHDPIDPFPGLMSVDFEQCFESNTTVEP